MTKIKICGLKRIEDIEAANALRPDYIGFVFADFSHRYVNKETAAKLKEKLSREIKAVGVFVNENVSFVAELLNDGVIDIAQLHGDEDNIYIEELRRLICGNEDASYDKSSDENYEAYKPGADKSESDKTSGDKIRIIKAFNINKIHDISEIDASVADLVLVDSGTGSGETFDWNKLKEIRRPYILAGGLGPDNAKSAIENIHPYGLDVSSGVETDKLKDIEKMKRFVGIVRETDEEMCCISRAERENLEQILKLQYLAYQSEADLFKNRDIPPLRETLEELEEEFERGTVLKLVEGNRIIGSVRAYEENGTLYIGKLMVHPDRQKRGYGKTLLSEIEKYYPGKRYELFTSTRSIDNISLYKKCGYEIYDSKVISDELEFVYMEKKGKKI